MGHLTRIRIPAAGVGRTGNAVCATAVNEPFLPRSMRLIGLAAFALSLASGCALWQPTTVPMRTVLLPAACAAKADTLVVFLPGSWSAPEDYMREGFVAKLRARHVVADVLLPDAHLGYYSERSIIDRLHADVIVKARASGYRHLWLVGISIGAYGALIHSVAPPTGELAGVDGLVLIAPYLGDRRVSTSIDSSGGLRHWLAPAVPQPPNEDDQTVSPWLQGYTSGADRPPLWLGYGLSDRFAFSDRLLADGLPAARVFTVAGGHDWSTWNALWDRLLPALPLPVDASCSPG